MSTIKVLSLDGGGVRGIITSRLLELFCDLAGIPGDEIYNHFDIIAGTSIGGIQALAYAKGLTPTYVKNLLIDNAATIFNCTYPIPGGGQASYGTWSGYLTGIYGSLYSQTPLKSLIDDNFGTSTINDTSVFKTNLLVPSFQRYNSDGDSVNVPVYFSNISSEIVPYLSGRTEKAANIALATSAAPVYFPPAVFGGNTYVDGGVFLNNASDFAVAAQRAINPVANRFCVLSIGTGLGSIGYIPDEPTTESTEITIEAFSSPIDNLNTIKMVMDVSMSIPPEGVAAQQQIISSYTVGNYYFCRMQYPIDSSQQPDSSLDNPSTEFIEYMQESAETYFNENIDTFITFAARLNA